MCVQACAFPKRCVQCVQVCAGAVCAGVCTIFHTNLWEKRVQRSPQSLSYANTGDINELKEKMKLFSYGELCEKVRSPQISNEKTFPRDFLVILKRLFNKCFLSTIYIVMLLAVSPPHHSVLPVVNGLTC